MDLSRLPRLSETGQSTQTEPSPDQHEPAPPQPPPPQVPVAQVWISVAIGVILLLIYPYFAQWLLSLVSDYKAPFLPITDRTTGLEVPYPRSIFFLDHLSVFAFAMVLIVEGIALMLLRRPVVLMMAFGLTCIATALNLLNVVLTMNRGGALPIISTLAVVFGVYIAMNQWALLKPRRSALDYY